MRFSEITQQLKDSKDLCFLSLEERKELQNVLTSMLKDFIRVCEDNNLTYVLIGGTALGAVRHQGFIPWDDDIDVAMPRADYEKFKKCYVDNLSEKYTYYVPNSSFKSLTAFGKLMKKGTKMTDIFTCSSNLDTGIFIDIAPIDYVPDNKAIRSIKGFFANVLIYSVNSAFMYKYNNEIAENFLKKNKAGYRVYKRRVAYGKLCSLVSLDKLTNIFDNFVQHKPSLYMTVASSRGHYDGETVEASTFLPTSKAVFDGVEVCMPNSPDMYLENLYGNYMEIPSEEKRERHCFVELKF